MLTELGFSEGRRHPDVRDTTVPFHQGRDIAPTLALVRKIARDIKLEIDHFLAQL